MGIFNLFKRSNDDGPPPLERQASHLAFVLLREPVMPSVEDLLGVFDQVSGSDETLSVSTDGDEDEERGDVMMLNIEGMGTAFVALVPAPVPEGEAEAGFEYSLASFADEAKLEDHAAHLLVTLMGIDQERLPVEGMMAFTSLLTALVQATPCVGVYWGNAGATHTAEFFLAMGSEYDLSTRISLWTGLSRAPEDGGKMSFLSLGMDQLALPDLYLICEIDQASEGLGRVFDLLSYVAERGEPIPQGDTIGATARERIPVEYVPSPTGDDSMVWKVTM